MRPASPTLVSLLAGVVVFALPGLQPLLVYDREAILAGELWRLFAGHWIHFSASHLVWNLLVLGLVGLLLERRGTTRWLAVLVVSPWLIGAGLLVLEPRMQFYGGLSGVATAAVVFLALDSARNGVVPRWAAALVLAVIAAKVVFEWNAQRAIFVGSASAGFTPSALSHFLGGAVAAVFCWVVPASGEAVRRQRVGAGGVGL